MKAKYITALTATLASAAALNSCVLQTNPVPEIPYRPRPVVVSTAPQHASAPQITTWETAPDPTNHITEAPVDRLPGSTAVEPKPVDDLPEPPPAPEPVQPAASPAPEPTVAPAITPLELTPFTPTTPSAPAAAAAAATSATDLSKITNDGPIPTAARVEGDPTRVWNPLDPSKKIRIINPKTNQPYPSGKKLKVRGTNYQFYVP